MDIKTTIKDTVLALWGPLVSVWIGRQEISFEWYLIAGLSFVIIFLIIKIYRNKASYEKHPKLGVRKISDGFLAVDAAKKSNSQFFFLGISGNRTVNDVKFQEAILRLARSGGDVRFLLMHPLSPEIKRRAKDEGVSSDIWVHDINATAVRLTELATRENASIKIRYSGAYPYWRMIISDRKLVYLNYFIDRKRFTDSPTVELEQIDSGVASTFLKIFDDLWDSASEDINRL